MLQIDFNGSKFTVDIDRTSFIDAEVFQSIIDYFKSLYLSFDPASKKWIIPSNRIDEVCLWFRRIKYEYSLTPNAVEQLKEISNTLYSVERIVERNKVFDESVLTPSTKLFDFQKDIINWILKRNVSMDALDTGGGKTIVTISVISHRFKEGSIDGIFIITPDGTQYNWIRSFLNFSNVFAEEDFYVINNDNKIKPFDRIKDKKVVLVASHLLKDVFLSYKKGYKMGSSAKLIRWRDGAFVNLKKEWSKKSIACVVDESHLYKRTTSVKTKALLANKKYFDYRYMLSATPNITRIEDIYSQFKFLDKSLIPFSEEAFKLWLAKDLDKYSNITSYNVENVDALKAKYPLVMIQVLKENLPEMKFKKEVNPIYLNMTYLQHQLYTLIWEEEIERLLEEYDELTWKILGNKLHHLTMAIDCPEVLKQNTYKNDNITSLLKKWDMKFDPKFVLLKSKLEDYVENRDEKVIVFDSSPQILDLLFEKFKKYNPLIIHGALKDVKDKAKDRDEKERLFNEDPSHKVIFLSSHTSSRSINLQKMCHRAIYYSVPWDAEQFRQGQDRVYRITSTHDTYVEPFVMDKTIDLIRYGRAINRIEMNDTMMKNLSNDDLNNLLRGIV